MLPSASPSETPVPQVDRVDLVPRVGVQVGERVRNVRNVGDRISILRLNRPGSGFFLES